MHEASVHGEGGQISTALRAGNAADGGGGGVEKCCGGRHKVHVPAPFAKLDALGSPRARETPARWEEFVKSWPRQWQTLVALFAEKRKGLKESVAPADFRGSSGDEF